VEPVRPKPQRDWHNRIVDYLYWLAQNTNSQSEHEDITLSLAIFVCKNVEEAYYRAFGVGRVRFLAERAKREWEMARAIIASAPTPSEQPASEHVRPPAVPISISASPAKPQRIARPARAVKSS